MALISSSQSKRFDEALPPHSDLYGGQRFAGQPSQRGPNRDRLPRASLQSTDASVACSILAGANDGIGSRKRQRRLRAESAADHLLGLEHLFLSDTGFGRTASIIDAGAVGQASFGFAQRRYPIGYAIIRPGERGHSVYVVLSGRVRVAETLPDNSTDTYVAELRQGEVFGELDVLKERTRSVTVVALETTECLMIPDVDFLEALRSSPETMMGMVRLMDRRLVEADRSLALLRSGPIDRLASDAAPSMSFISECRRVQRRGNSVLLIAVDVVHLKTINDRHGYNVGDEVLRAVADVLVDASRDTDLVARYGPDEFAAFLVEAGAEHADIVVRRIQQKFQAAIGTAACPLNQSCVLDLQ